MSAAYASVAWLLVGCLFSCVASMLLAPPVFEAFRVRIGVARARAKHEAKPRTVQGRIFVALAAAYSRCPALRGGEGSKGSAHRKLGGAKAAELRRELDQSGLGEGIGDRSLDSLAPAFALAFACAFGILGCVLSGELGLLGLLVGIAMGWGFPRRAIAAEAKAVREECRADIPRMLDIVSLASHAGLTFDRAFDLYATSFRSELARRARACIKCYSQGAKTRDEALCSLARELAIPELSQFADSVRQSIRFGVPLSPALEQLATLSRKEVGAAMSEKVAKAPVKMLIPMGLFILPAMLILVMGPILLNMLSQVG